MGVPRVGGLDKLNAIEILAFATSIQAIGTLALHADIRISMAWSDTTNFSHRLTLIDLQAN